MSLIKLGIIANTKGIEGKMTIINSPKDIFIPEKSIVFIGYSENFVEQYSLSEDFVGQIGRADLVLKEVTTKESAQQLKEKGVFAEKDEVLRYNEGYIFVDDILECDVLDMEQNKIIGKIVDIWEMPANNIWIVRTKQGNIPLPVIDDVIKECDFENKIIKIKMLDGLEDLIIK